MNKIKVIMDRPIYIGMSILDMSKTLMYDFHYNKMIQYYGRNKLEICYVDTDAYMLRICTEDLYEDLRSFKFRCDFDFSDYPETHPTYDNGVNKKFLDSLKMK